LITQVFDVIAKRLKGLTKQSSMSFLRPPKRRRVGRVLPIFMAEKRESGNTDPRLKRSGMTLRTSRLLCSLAMMVGSIFFLFYFFSSLLFALEIPKRPEGYVSDYARMISASKRVKLEETLRQFEEKASNQVIVVTFPSLEGESLEDFSIRLAEAWKIGQKEKNNGVILLIFKNDRKVRIEVGYGLEGVLTDATSKLIIENEIVPRFKQGKFDEGIEGAINAIMAATRGEYRVQSTSFPIDWNVVAALAVLLLILIYRFYGLVNMFSSNYTITGSGRRRSYWSGSGFGGGVSGGGFGGGGFSGGGGSFGGGGASGSW